MSPTIVISAYNRPHALGRLLESLARGWYPSHSRVSLVVSIDRGPDGIDPRVRRAAETFAWPNGRFDIIEQPERLGLVRHVLYCCGLSDTVGDTIFLEDDLSASPALYDYATRALDFYRDDEAIAGHCLYALWFNGYTGYPFTPLADGGDTFFLQVPYTQGQAYTADQWRRLSVWLRAQDDGSHAARLHPYFSQFDRQDWYPAFARYAAATGRYTVYPRESLTTGAGDAGVHFARPSPYFEAPVQWRPRAYRFHALADALAVYDSFFEIRPDRLSRLASEMQAVAFDTDLNASKQPNHLHAPHVLTTRTARGALRRYGLRRWPAEANVLDSVAGEGIALCERDDVCWDAWAQLQTEKRLYDYYTRRRPTGLARQLLYRLIGLLDRRRPD